ANKIELLNRENQKQKPNKTCSIKFRAEFIQPTTNQLQVESINIERQFFN
ncbi:14244_t:CDS:1, partial [Dentiscutata erythropus]